MRHNEGYILEKFDISIEHLKHGLKFMTEFVSRILLLSQLN